MLPPILEGKVHAKSFTVSWGMFSIPILNSLINDFIRLPI